MPTVFGALLATVALYIIITALIWIAYRIPGLPGVVSDLAKSIGVKTLQLAVFIAVQLWITRRRAGAAEATAAAAMQTAEATVKSNTAQRFKDAVELVGIPYETVRMGGILALGFIAQDYPEYQDAAYVIINARAQQLGLTNHEKLAATQQVTMEVLFTGHSPTSFKGKEHNLRLRLSG